MYKKLSVENKTCLNLILNIFNNFSIKYFNTNYC